MVQTVHKTSNTALARAGAETWPPVDVKRQERVSVAKDHHSAADEGDNLQQHPQNPAAQLYTVLPNTRIYGIIQLITVVVCGHGLVILSLTINETLKWLS